MPPAEMANWWKGIPDWKWRASHSIGAVWFKHLCIVFVVVCEDILHCKLIYILPNDTVAHHINLPCLDSWSDSSSGQCTNGWCILETLMSVLRNEVHALWILCSLHTSWLWSASITWIHPILIFKGDLLKSQIKHTTTKPACLCPRKYDLFPVRTSLKYNSLKVTQHFLLELSRCHHMRWHICVRGNPLTNLVN